MTKHFAQRLRVAIAAKNAETLLVEELGVSLSILRCWQSGKYSPEPKTVRRIAAILQVPEKWLLEDRPVRFWPELVGGKEAKEVTTTCT